MISVVMPVYNEAANIISTLEALYSNTVLPAGIVL